MRYGGFDKAGKQRMSITRRRGEFWVELTAYEPRVVWNLNDFHQHTIDRFPYQLQARLCKHIDIVIVELVTMTMTLYDLLLAIALVRC